MNYAHPQKLNMLADTDGIKEVQRGCKCMDLKLLITQKRKRCTNYDQIAMHKHATHKLLQATHTHNSHQSKCFCFSFFFIKKIKSVSVLCKVQSCSYSGDGLLTAGTALTDTHGSIHDETTASGLHRIVEAFRTSVQARLCDYAEHTWKPAAGLETAPIDGWRHIY